MPNQSHLTRHYKLTHLQAEYEKIRREKDSSEGMLEETRRKNEETRQILGKRYDRMRLEYQDAHSKFYSLKASAIRVREERDVLKRQLASLTSAPPVAEPPTNQTNAELEVQVAKLQEELFETRKRIDEATRTDGRIWMRPGAVTASRCFAHANSGNPRSFPC